ncbi:tRNA (N(6)-L-threonylcarbamoyladenosine(37)-C(2))-methylthiotransferase MtaB [Persicobacter sp. CCB-QB2]|uniref:tRNA (N(6)-L-threonylcarbamoyladenosine(37)-C(2))- methylthiotransferase MtaB n=1 Tax=Persicobacter sp. CCB-QB2 TaxID=1561025 RepID=UPI0006A9E249|nr:tRNA (N(6)-L-threonylcarbamoyladenosine(37)-C(2))-methylthiotransferase MtaB [Persicobacter sp. CCB-QB2]
MKKVAFYTLGCKLNFSETSTIARNFEERGYRKVEFDANPDIFIINTCSVTDNADKKCRKVVQEAMKINPKGYVAILGCYAQLKPKEIATIDGVDAVFGAAEKFRLLDILDENFQPKVDPFTQEKKAEVYYSDIEDALDYHNAYSLNDRTRTFLKVQDGCDYPCTYCTIPMARGASRSDTIENVVKSAKEIVAAGVKEIVLTGVNTGDFGIRNGQREDKFVDLAKALDKVEGIERIRISSIEPNLLTDEIIEFTAQSEKFVPHFHIPLQSGSPEILRLMKRRYKRDLYADRVKKIKELMPHCGIGVDVIVGFPGETEERFLETYNFLSELPISYLHVFPYSERPNTEAVDMGEVVPIKERSKRAKMLRILSEKKRRQFYQEHIDKNYTVLFEDEIHEGKMLGFTENYIRVAAKYDPMLINELKQVKMKNINEQGQMEIDEIETIFEKH